MYLVEDNFTHKRFAIKKIICHSNEDQKTAIQEIEYHSLLKHSNIIECIDSSYNGVADTLANSTSQVLLVLPYYHVRLDDLIHVKKLFSF